MALNPTLAEQELLAETFRRTETPMPRAERLSEVVIGLGFAAAAAGVWAIRPPGAFAIVPGLLCVLVLVLATRVRFDTPFGFTVATQLAFVPLVFAVPVAIAPIAVVAAIVIGDLPEVITGKARPERLLLALGNSWFAIGPALVFAASGTQPRHAGVSLLIVALGAQFTVDIAVSTLRCSIDRRVNLTAQLRDAWVYGVDGALSGIALAVAEEIHSAPIVALAPLPLLALLAVFARERHQRMQSLIELGTAYRGTALVLGEVVEADDGYTGRHCKSVVQLALALGDELGLNDEQRRNLEFGALLHDVGKIVVPKEIINKPGKLDPHEWAIVTTHTIQGQKMLDQVGGFMRTVGLIVRSHHERWDGRGYPDGLSGEAIPLEARIITCCDSWNAMRTDRAYRKALSLEAARAELVANMGHQFDPHIVEAFLRIKDTLDEEQPQSESQPASSGADQSPAQVALAPEVVR